MKLRIPLEEAKGRVGGLLEEAEQILSALAVDDNLIAKRLSWTIQVSNMLGEILSESDLTEFAFDNPELTGTIEAHDKAADRLTLTQDLFNKDIVRFRRLKVRLHSIR